MSGAQFAFHPDLSVAPSINAANRMTGIADIMDFVSARCWWSLFPAYDT
jgi:hypothetical protein